MDFKSNQSMRDWKTMINNCFESPSSEKCAEQKSEQPVKDMSLHTSNVWPSKGLKAPEEICKKPSRPFTPMKDKTLHTLDVRLSEGSEVKEDICKKSSSTQLAPVRDMTFHTLNLWSSEGLEAEEEEISTKPVKRFTKKTKADLKLDEMFAKAGTFRLNRRQLPYNSFDGAGVNPYTS